LGILGEKSRILDFLGRILELFWRSSGKNFRPFFGNNVLKPSEDSASDGTDDKDNDSDADIRALCATKTDKSTKDKPRARLERSDVCNDPLL